MNEVEAIRLIKTANTLDGFNDQLSQMLAGQYREQVRQWCRQSPEATEHIHRMLPAGYQLIPHG